jgi:hypothetical protein
MEHDKQVLEAWEDSVSLEQAWWVYADLQKKRGFDICNKPLRL